MSGRTCGTYSSYVSGCRCDCCRTAAREHMRAWRAKRARAEGRTPYDVISVPEGDTSWMPSAACRNEDTETFFPPKGSGNRFDKTAALRVCASCDVRKACLDYALRTNQQEGIWGMTTPHERLTMRRQVAS